MRTIPIRTKSVIRSQAPSRKTGHLQDARATSELIVVLRFTAVGSTGVAALPIEPNRFESDKSAAANDHYEAIDRGAEDRRYADVVVSDEDAHQDRAQLRRRSADREDR